jgi:flagellar capping protein FliD
MSACQSIDVNQILSAIITAERANMMSLEVQKAALCAQRNAYATLADKLRALESSLEAPISDHPGSPAANAEHRRSTFTAAYNDVMSFVSHQNTAVGSAAIGRGGIVRELIAGLRDVVQSDLFAAAIPAAAFVELKAAVNRYTRTGGPIHIARDQLRRQISTLEMRLESMERQLELRRAALQEEFVAADLLMRQITGQESSLQALNGQYRLF